LPLRVGDFRSLIGLCYNWLARNGSASLVASIPATSGKQANWEFQKKNKRSTMDTRLTFDELLDSIDQLPIDQQETLVEVIQRRLIDLRRQEIAKHAADARKLYFAGQLPHGTVEDLMADLDKEDEA
jgi:hypothetical protein